MVNNTYRSLRWSVTAAVHCTWGVLVLHRNPVSACIVLVVRRGCLPTVDRRSLVFHDLFSLVLESGGAGTAVTAGTCFLGLCVMCGFLVAAVRCVGVYCL